MTKGWDSSSDSDSDSSSSSENDKKHKPPKRSKSLESLKPHQRKAHAKIAKDKATKTQYDEKGKPIPRKLTAEELQNSSIIRDPGVPEIPTIVGPIAGWAPVDDNLPNHPTMAFFGKRRTGKSTTITNILFHCCLDIPFGIVMSDTAYAG